MKKLGIILGSFIAIILLSVIVALLYYKYAIGPVSDSDKVIAFEIKDGDTYYSIGQSLEEKGLIKSEKIYRIYLKLNKPGELKVGQYSLSPNMGIEKIVEILNGDGISTDIVITFKEGSNMYEIAKLIASKTNNSEEDVYSLLKDQTYLKELIEEYWFLDDTILNKDIYYPLEGYLFPNTYNFKNKDVTVKEIFKKLLDETGKQLEPYRNNIKSSSYNIHQILTLASIVELEASQDEYRDKIASVLYNRLKNNISLGSDPTTYYGSKIFLRDRQLTKAELDDVNAYNTRSILKKDLPVGPICNPSLKSIVAALKPASTNYLFFVSDKNGKIYFTQTNREHEQKIAQLKKDGLWE